MARIGRIAGVLALLAGMAGAGELLGPARVIDGNHLEVDGVVVRLAGIRAPEPGTICRTGEREYDCGRIAATALMDLTAGVSVRCLLDGEAGGVALARCTDPHGFSLNRNMVYTGWALADEAAYAGVEAEARRAGRGMWRGGGTGF